MEKVKFENLSKPLKLIIVWGWLNLAWLALMMLFVAFGALMYILP